jgi:hypothetical protein
MKLTSYLIVRQQTNSLHGIKDLLVPAGAAAAAAQW